MAVTFPHAYLLLPTIPEKRERMRCISHGCRRKGDADHHRCPVCRSRLYRLKNPERYAYGNLRSSARKRHIPFELTFEEFVGFCSSTEYIEKRGKNPDSLTIDREKRSLPYQKGNLRIMTYQENVTHVHEEKPDPTAPADF